MSRRNTKIVALGIALSMSLMLSGVAEANDGARSSELYHIFDFKTSATKSQVIKAALAGIQNNISESETLTPIVMDAPPEQPQRFRIIDQSEAMANSPMGAFMAMMPASQRAMLKRASCEGAIWIATSKREVRNWQHLTLQLCIYQYKAGYQLDVYGVDSVERGGGISAIVGRAVAGKLVGSPEAWTNKTILDLVRSIKTRTGAETSYLEGQPEFEGKPWDDQSQIVANAENTQIKQ